MLKVSCSSSNNRILNAIPNETSIDQVTQTMPGTHMLRVEEIPNDQLTVDKTEHLLPVAHFHKVQVQFSVTCSSTTFLGKQIYREHSILFLVFRTLKQTEGNLVLYG